MVMAVLGRGNFENFFEVFFPSATTCLEGHLKVSFMGSLPILHSKTALRCCEEGTTLLDQRVEKKYTFFVDFHSYLTALTSKTYPFLWKGSLLLQKLTLGGISQGKHIFDSGLLLCNTQRYPQLINLCTEVSPNPLLEGWA